MGSNALTERDWERVFELRCRAKRGEYMSPEHQKFLEQAFAADGERYTALGDQVFEATKPFGAK